MADTHRRLAWLWLEAECNREWKILKIKGQELRPKHEQIQERLQLLWQDYERELQADLWVAPPGPYAQDSSSIS